jgi:hypothetical protein
MVQRTENITNPLNLAATSRAPGFTLAAVIRAQRRWITKKGKKYRTVDELRPLFHSGRRTRLSHTRFG